MDELSVFVTSSRPLTIESISSKIKLLAQRKQYLSGLQPSASVKSNHLSKLDCFENVDETYMWRWELSSIDLLPQQEAAEVKKARSLRRKLQGHHKAIIRLISSINDATKWLQNSASAPSTSLSSTHLLAKVSDMEEKVLKFEREEEKARLLREVKLKKDQSQAGELAEKQKEKKRLEEERLKEKKRKEEEREQKKIELAKEREDAKQRKIEEKEKEKLLHQK